MFKMKCVMAVACLTLVAHAHSSVTLLQESFENGFNDWTLLTGNGDTSGTTGWEIVETTSAIDGSKVAELQSYEPAFGECVNKNKILRSPAIGVRNSNLITLTYYYDLTQTTPDTDYKATPNAIRMFALTPEQVLALDSGNFDLRDALPISTSETSSKRSWRLLQAQLDESDISQLGSEFSIAIQYRNSTSGACERFRVDSVEVTGDITTPVLDTRLVKPASIGGTRFFKTGEVVEFVATTGPDEPEAFTYNWLIYDNVSTVPLVNTSGRQISQTFNNPGTYRVSVAAVNPQGMADPTPITLNFRVVDSLELRPSIIKPNGHITRVLPGESVIFEAGVQGATKRQNISLEWHITQMGAQRNAVILEGNGFEHQFQQPGKFLIELLAVTDNGFVSMDLDRRIVDVSENFVEITSPRPSRGVRGKIIAEVNESMTFTAKISSMDPQNTRLVWWRYPEKVEICSNVTTCEISFPDAGNRAVVAMLMNGDEVVAKDMVYVSVSPGIYASISSPEPDAYFAVGEALVFRTDILGSKSDNATVQWMVGNSTASGQEVVRSEGISKPGTYQAKVVTIASDGTRSQDAVRFTIFDPSTLGDGNITSPRTNLNIRPSVPVLFNAVLSNTPNELHRPLWRIFNVETGELLKEKYNQLAGTLRFSEPGAYRAQFFLRGDQGEKLVDERLINVISQNPSAYQDNDALSKAAEMNFGRYHNMVLDRGHFFETTIPDNGLTLRINTEQLEEEAEIVLYAPDGDRIVARNIAGAEPFQLAGVPAGTYTWGILPTSEASAKKSLSFSIAIEVLNPALFFSDIQANENFDTELGMVNPTNGESQAQISAYDSRGQVLDKVDMNLSAGASVKESVNNLFPNIASDIAWIGVDATREMVGYTNVVSLDAERAYAVSGVSHLSDQLFVPHIAQATDTWFTEARVINGISEDALPEVESGAFQSTLENTTSYSKSSFDFANKFGGNINSGDRWARFYDSMGQASLGGNEVFGTHDQTRVVGLGLADLPSKSPSFTSVVDRIFFTHIANPNDFWTAMALVNTSSVTTDVEIVAFSESGQELGRRFQTIQGFGTYTNTSDAFLGDIPNANQTGWIEVLHSGTVMGYELFGTVNNKQMAGLEAITDLKNEICFPFLDGSGSSYHGFSVVNVEDTSVDVMFQLYDAAGQVKDSITRSVNPKQKEIFLFENLFGEITIDAGWIKASSSSSLAGFQLFGNPETMSGLVAQ